MLTVGSLFAGVGGFDKGFEDAGLHVLWQVEIDPECRRVLRHHWPDALLLSDVRDCGKHNLPPVDVISFGSPCQDLSVAGKRKGMAGERSGLFYEAIRIVRELQPTLAVWENVPGALSSHAGRDFAQALHALRECGARDICWRVLDARYFGVAQRRRRVFLVADFRGERAAQILLESPCGCGDSPPRCPAEAGVAGSLGAGARGSGWRDDLDRCGTFVPTMSSNGDAHSGFRCEHGLVAAGLRGNPAADHIGDESKLVVTHTLRAEGCDAGEDGTGRGTPLTVVPINMRQASRGETMTNNRGGDSSGGAPGTGIGEEGDPAPTLADSHTPAVGLLFIDAYACRGSASPNQHPVSGAGVSDALDTTGPGAVAFAQNQRDEVRDLNGLAGALASQSGMKQQTYVAFDWQSGGDVRHNASETHTSALQASQTPANGGGRMMVRRLTPTECCRLQAFPDNWLDLEPPVSDSAKYRCLGNAVCVAVARWLGRRILNALALETPCQTP